MFNAADKPAQGVGKNLRGVVFSSAFALADNEVCKLYFFGVPTFTLYIVIGSSEFRQGQAETGIDQYIASPRTQPAIGEEMIDALVELHDFEWRGTTLVVLARPERFLERQVERWMSQLEDYRCRDLAGVDEVAKWLDENRPESGNPGGMDAQYCQSPQVLIDRYTTATGRDMTHFRWYQAFAAWKLGIVLEGSYAKYLSGESKNPNHEFFGFVVDQLMERAQRFANQEF